MARPAITITRNDISPRLAKMAKAAREPERVFRAMGNVFKSITEGNFNSSGAHYRPRPWPAKKDGTPSNLKKSGLLWHSFHLTVTRAGATLSNPTPYAAVHQFGSAKKSGRGSGIPARPFFPIQNGRLTPAASDLIGKAASREILRQAGLK